MATVDPVRGGERLQEYLNKMAKKLGQSATVRAGFLEGSTYAGTDTPIATIAAIQNFGAPAAGIPPRPFFSNTVNKNAGEWGKRLGFYLKSTDFDAEKALGQVGVDMQADIYQAIVDLTSPALSPVTLLLRERFGNNPQEITFADVQKARSDIKNGTKPNVTPTQGKPLVWTGQLLHNIDYEVEIEGEVVMKSEPSGPSE